MITLNDLDSFLCIMIDRERKSDGLLIGLQTFRRDHSEHPSLTLDVRN
jgi:hypothetical protein